MTERLKWHGFRGKTVTEGRPFRGHLFCQDSPLRAQTEAANLRQQQVEDRATGRTRVRPLSEKTKWYISAFESLRKRLFKFCLQNLYNLLYFLFWLYIRKITPFFGNAFD